MYREVWNPHISAPHMLEESLTQCFISPDDVNYPRRPEFLLHDAALQDVQNERQGCGSALAPKLERIPTIALDTEGE
jgi:hypothetical protein